MYGTVFHGTSHHTHISIYTVTGSRRIANICVCLCNVLWKLYKYDSGWLVGRAFRSQRINGTIIKRGTSNVALVNRRAVADVFTLHCVNLPSCVDTADCDYASWFFRQPKLCSHTAQQFMNLQLFTVLREM